MTDENAKEPRDLDFVRDEIKRLQKELAEKEAAAEKSIKSLERKVRIDPLEPRNLAEKELWQFFKSILEFIVDADSLLEDIRGILKTHREEIDNNTRSIDGLLKTVETLQEGSK